MTPEALKNLAFRLSIFQHPRCVEAAKQVRRAIENSDRFGRADAEQALCHEVWRHLDAAIDDEDDAGSRETALDAMRAEMAGRVYTCRLALGWIVRAPTAPEVCPTLADLGL
jgi:hypothetical protein